MSRTGPFERPTGRSNRRAPLLRPPSPLPKRVAQFESGASVPASQSSKRRAPHNAVRREEDFTRPAKDRTSQDKRISCPKFMVVDARRRRAPHFLGEPQELARRTLVVKPAHLQLARIAKIKPPLVWRRTVDRPMGPVVGEQHERLTERHQRNTNGPTTATHNPSASGFPDARIRPSPEDGKQKVRV